MNWYKESIESTLEKLDTDRYKGLSEEESKKRIEKYGLNELKEKDKKSFLSKLIAQFNDFLVIILIVASIVSMLVGEKTDALIIIAIVIVNAILGLVQEGKAEKSLEALKKMASPYGKVLRDGHVIHIPSNKIVPGDVVLLEAGDIIPADLRLIESYNLKVEEASLTGESVPVDKDGEKIISEDAGIGDRTNTAYMSTVVTYGRGKGIVVGTGENTEIGKIATMIQTYEEEATPLQKKLNQLGKYLGMGCIVICALVFLMGIIEGENILDMFMVSISLAVAAIPEGLPAVVTIVLALGMNKMVKRNAIVKRLLAVETLGCTTTICSDKTGTLTQNEMTVVKTYTINNLTSITGKGYAPKGEFISEKAKIVPQENKDLNLLLSINVLCNDATLELSQDNIYKIVGDPTEGALVTLAEKGNLKKKDMMDKYPRIAEIPFDSDRKMMTTFHKNYPIGKIVSFTKGAPDIIVNRCNRVYINGEIQPLTEEIKKNILEMNNSFSRDALRVLASSCNIYDELPKDLSPENIENNLIFVGLVGMIDPPRNEAIESIKSCKNAGINTIMITGDYKETAFAVAKELGLAENIEEAVTGEDLNKMSDEELKEKVKNIKIYARVSPEHKVRIVNALKSNGEIVAMTGDGVNDALALKKADIGVSMGITGTDVAKNTADVILTDDNFASIVSAVEEGRIIYSNIRKFVFFLLSCNIGEILIVFLSLLFNVPVPLIPIQLLWLNLVTDSFPALALGVERGEPDIMNNSPRDPKESILNKSMIVGIAIQSIAITVAVLLAYRWGLKIYGYDNLIMPRTIAFTTLILSELIRSFSSRSERYTLFKIGFFTNKTIIYANLISLLLLFVVLYIPFLQTVFKIDTMAWREWSVVLRFCLIPIIAGELNKVALKSIHQKN